MDRNGYKEEVWEDIENYEGLYQISNLGRVKSLPKYVGIHHRLQETMILKSSLDSHGYFQVNLSKNDKNKMMLVHRLVARAFIPNPNNYPQINHKDENPQNNRVDNLEWCTAKYNANYGTAIERRKEKCSMPIICLETGVIYPSIIEASRELKIATSSIRNVVIGEKFTIKGLHFCPLNNTKTIQEIEKNRKRNNMQIMCIETGCVYKNIVEASKDTNTYYSSIHKALKGKINKAGGYHWRYYENKTKQNV